MKDRIWFGRTSEKVLRLFIAIILLIFAGRSFNARAQTETNLYWFNGIDGSNPVFGLVQGHDGNFYGVTVGGATQDVCSGHCGTIFKISSNGSLTNLYWFSGSDGTSPSWLVQGSDGNFYGTAAYGGTNACNCGTVFRISPSGSLTTLYTFNGPPNDGAVPWAGLVQGSDGNLYGTTTAGGTNGCNCGTVFQISPGGSYTSLHSFGPDGQRPVAALVQGSDGNFYGTTQRGGRGGGGIAFRISPSGSFTNLHSFGSADGNQLVNALTQGTDGNFYGTAPNGGATGFGTVFRISPSGSFTNLHSFSGSDGYGPNSVLVQGSDGNFYGTTVRGGTNSCECGIVFRISPSGSLTTVYTFSGSDGAGPNGLVQGSDGSFYGNTYGDGNGSVFRFSVPLNPPANQISAAQVSGNDLTISVPSVAGETYQLQFTTDPACGIWSNVPGVSVTNSLGALLTLTNFGGALQPQGFYRFAITP